MSLATRTATNVNSTHSTLALGRAWSIAASEPRLCEMKGDVRYRKSYTKKHTQQLVT